MLLLVQSYERTSTHTVLNMKSNRLHRIENSEQARKAENTKTRKNSFSKE